jgi:hypothetical protein
MWRASRLPQVCGSDAADERIFSGGKPFDGHASTFNPDLVPVELSVKE